MKAGAHLFTLLFQQSFDNLNAVSSWEVNAHGDAQRWSYPWSPSPSPSTTTTTTTTTVAATYDDLGQGKCITGRTKEGTDPAHVFHSGIGTEACKERCSSDRNCYGYSVSHYSNCIHWTEPCLSGSGPDWGDAHCHRKQMATSTLSELCEDYHHHGHHHHHHHHNDSNHSNHSNQVNHSEHHHHHHHNDSKNHSDHHHQHHHHDSNNNSNNSDHHHHHHHETATNATNATNATSTASKIVKTHVSAVRKENRTDSGSNKTLKPINKHVPSVRKESNGDDCDDNK